VPNGGNGAVVFLVGLEVELAAELGLAVEPAAAAVVTAKAAIATRNISVGMPMAGIWH
jgi:hypothetical protein